MPLSAPATCCDVLRHPGEIFDVGLAAEVAVGRGLLVLGLPQGEGRGHGSLPAAELDLQDVRAVLGESARPWYRSAPG